jgi:calcineurin-like phosphoesterase family protein
VRRLLVFSIAVASLLFVSCKTAEVKDPLKERIDEYLSVNPNTKELFRVLMMSDRYLIAQMNHTEKILRNEDSGGDRYMTEELKKFDKIDEEREGVIAVWLYPDSGRLMKVRPKKLTYLMEIDKLIVEDIQRWSFQFPAKDVYPTQFDVRYRVILRKTLSDDEIMKEVRDKIIEKTGSR